LETDVHVTFEPLFGLASLTEYDFTPIDGAEGLYTLRSLEDPGIRLFLLDAARYLPGYRPVLPAHLAATRLLVVATPAPDGTTVNLLAPILIDEQAATGCQIVVDGDVSDVHAPLRTGEPVHADSTGAAKPVVTSSRR
jgi:flagellar assembly factor FliW